jgi:hypothetical protein
MLNSVNQIRVELQEIANAHLQINNFFWGDFLRAYKEDTELNYVLMGCFYPTASLLNNQTQLTLTIYICDRVYKDYSNLNDVESDTLQICRDVYNVINSSFRWKRLGRVQSASAQKFIERGGDEVAGHTLTIQFLLRDVSGICELPMEGYDFEQNVSPAPTCEPVQYSITNSALYVLHSGEIPSGGTFDLIINDCTAELSDTDGNLLSTTGIPAEDSGFITAPDAALHIKKENDGTITNLTLLSGSNTEYIVDNNDISVNGVFEFDIHATENLDIRLRDQSNNVITPVSVTETGNHATIVLPNAPAQITTATLMKTGQTISYRTKDDGDIEAGRATSFTVLASPNPFNNTNRFTDELGGQTYTNNIVIDWSTYNGSNVLGYKKTKNGSYVTWNTAIDSAAAYSVGSFTSGWRLLNTKELNNLYNYAVSSTVLNYAPFSFNADTNIWTSTTYQENTLQAHASMGISVGGFTIQVKTNAVAEWMACRTFTVTGTTLT